MLPMQNAMAHAWVIDMRELLSVTAAAWEAASEPCTDVEHPDCCCRSVAAGAPRQQGR
jgi:hypothetical protein